MTLVLTRQKVLKQIKTKKFPTSSENATSGFYNFYDPLITLHLNYGLYFSFCGHTLPLILLHPYSKTSVRNLIVNYLSSLYTLHHVLFLHVTLPYSPIVLYVSFLKMLLSHDWTAL